MLQPNFSVSGRGLGTNESHEDNRKDTCSRTYGVIGVTDRY